MDSPDRTTPLSDLIDDALKCGWTLSGLATVTGMSQSNVSRLRCGAVSEDSRQGRTLRDFLDTDQKDRGYRAATAALGRVLARHPSRRREIMQFILRLDLLLADAPEPDRSRRGRRASPRPDKTRRQNVEGIGGLD